MNRCRPPRAGEALPGTRRSGRFAGVLAALLTGSAAPAATIRVPQDASTIAAGLAAASPGDHVVVAAGTWSEHDLVLPSDVVLRGATGDPADVVIDAQGLGRGGFTAFGAGPATELRHLTLRGGSTTSHGGGFYAKDNDLRVIGCRFESCHAGNWGGGLAFQGSSSPVIEDCVFTGNDALYGGGLYCETGAATVTRCVFENNLAVHAGGGMQAWYAASSPAVTDCAFDRNQCLVFSGGGFSVQYGSAALSGCTFHANRAGTSGAGIHASEGSLTLARCIVAFQAGGAEPVTCASGAMITVTCCDVFGNLPGDWIGCLAGLDGTAGNFAADPRFCDAAEGDLTLRESSPCAPDAGTCGRIGAHDVGCGGGPVAAPGEMRAASWARVKARYGERPAAPGPRSRPDPPSAPAREAPRARSSTASASTSPGTRP